ILLGAAVLTVVLALQGLVFGISAVAAGPAEWRQDLDLSSVAATQLIDVPRLEDSIASAKAVLFGLAPSLLGAHERAEAQAELAARLSALGSSNGLKVGALAPGEDSVSVGR